MKNLNESECPVSLTKLNVLYCAGIELPQLKMTHYLERKLTNLVIAKGRNPCLKLFKHFRPQLVIIEMDMSRESMALCEAIRDIDPDVAIIVVSSDDTKKLLHEAIRLGVSRYIIKPINYDDLMLSIDKVATEVDKQKHLLPKIISIDDAPYQKERVQHYINTCMLHKEYLADIRPLSFSKDEISGDFYIITHYKNTRYIMVADAMGHGLSAILPALQIPKLFKHLAKQGFSLLAIADEINNILISQSLTRHFVAATFVRIDYDNKLLAVLNCGNPAAFLINKGSTLEYEFKSQALALGVVKNENYDLEVEYFHFDEDVQLYVFTDGLPDTIQAYDLNSNSSCFSSIFTDKEPTEIFNHVEHLVKTAIQNHQFDDITLLEIPINTGPRLEENHVERFPANHQSVVHIDFKNKISDLKKNTLLCMEDDKHACSGLLASLERKIGKIITASNAIDGLHLFCEHHPNIVIISLSIIDMEDSSIIKEIRKHDSSVPILLLTNLADKISPEQLLELAPTKALVKPAKTEILVEAIQWCLEQKQRDQLLLLSSSVFLTSSLAMSITDKEKRIISTNPAFSKITGYSQQEVIGRNPKLLSSGKHDSQFYQTMWQSINETNHWSGEVWNRRKNGDLFLEWITINAITDESGKVSHYCSVFSDVTERKVAEETIRKLTYHDALTALPNRRLFLDRLEQEIKHSDRNSQQLAVLFIDLDSFKDVNDTLGHDLGDVLLREAAIRLSNCVKGLGTVARFGGDEFNVCLGGLDSLRKIKTITYNLQQKMAEPFYLADEEIFLTCSIGITIYPQDATNIFDLIRNADQAMFYAKAEGRNCAHYFKPAMQEKAQARSILIKDIRTTLDEDQFLLYYQPIVEMASGCIRKAEALIRWPHPIRGFVSPAEFIPVAEDTGMIVPIGNWVFHQASLQCKKWQNKYHSEFQISINKSPKQFINESNTHQNWLDYLEAINLLAQGIVVEITEGVLMDSNHSITNQLLEFRNAGIEVSLDDFGTGYSSLSYLRKFDIDYLKIDQSFVKNLNNSEDDQALCEAIIVMAHKLGIRVIAEGIETEAQRKILLDAGCDYGQGYLFSKPVSADDFEQMMTQSQLT